MNSFFNSKVNRLYSLHCCGQIVRLHLPVNPFEGLIELNWEQVYSNVEQLYQDIANGKIKPEALNEDFVREYVTTLSKPFKEGLSADFDNPNFTEPNYNFLREARTNLFHFAGAKTYQELRDLNDLFFKNGKVVGFAEFKRNVSQYETKVKKVKDQYRGDWLRAEYNHAVSTSQSAARWIEAEEVSDIFPNLIYRTVNDGRVRDSHKVLDKTVKPINDPFWDEFTPPNGWNCRCRVESTSEPVTDKEILLKLPKEFKNNPAKTGVIFKESHPYFTEHKKIREAIISRSDEFARNLHVEAQKDIYNAYNGRQNYSQVKFNEKSGGYLVKHANSERKLKPSERQTIDFLIEDGQGVVMKEYSRGDFTKNPDIQIQGADFELKHTSSTNSNSIYTRILEGFGQAKHVVIRFDKKEGIVSGVLEAMRKKKESTVMNGLMIIHDGKKVYLDKATLARGEQAVADKLKGL